METKTVHVKDLLGKHFNIPYYQRGYRWEEKQVNDLLYDLLEFYNKKDSSQFYCMQPLVVIENKKLSKENHIVYDLIDGQQRLTTIYLLLLYIKSVNSEFDEDLYTIQYERLGNSDKIFDINNLKELSKESIDLLSENNDFFFIFKAFQTISLWFNQKLIRPSIMLGILIGDGTNNEDQPDVRFLWYKPNQEFISPDETQVLRGSIDIFNRLNYGQTPLSSTDLIKAMIMICDIYPDNDRLIQDKEASRFATEWDSMEKRLHQRLLWSMLTSTDYNPSSRMELLLNYVANDMYNNKKEDWEKNAYAKIKDGDEDFSYRVISSYLLYSDKGNVAPKIYEGRVNHIWKQVQSIYHMFCNWFANRKTYHLIGLYVLLHEKIMGGELKSRYQLIEELKKDYTSMSRDKFIISLKKKIGSKITIKSTRKNQDNTTEQYTLDTINYLETPKDLVRILTLFNIDLTMEQLPENPLFDFELFKRTNTTSLEHIHPQNLNLKDEKLLDWYNQRIKILENHKKIPDPNTTKEEDRILLKAIDYLGQNLSKNKKSDEELKSCEAYLKIVDHHFDELAEISEQEMHTIKNMALVDGSANSGFSNELINRKRELMYQYAKEKTENGMPKHYMMLGTRLVFNKVFTPKECIYDMEVWGKNDRDAYFKQIEIIYQKYTKLE